MEPDRFDDVSFSIEEEPEPPRRPRRSRRVAAVVAVAALGVGALAAGASALTDSAKPAKASSATQREREFVRFHHSGRHHRGPCPNMGSSSSFGHSTADLAPRD
jgi:hypothetical protein